MKTKKFKPVSSWRPTPEFWTLIHSLLNSVHLYVVNSCDDFNASELESQLIKQLPDAINAFLSVELNADNARKALSDMEEIINLKSKLDELKTN